MRIKLLLLVVAVALVSGAKWTVNHHMKTVANDDFYVSAADPGFVNFVVEVVGHRLTWEEADSLADVLKLAAMTAKREQESKTK